MLKLKKLGAVAAAMALSLSLTTLPAAAADFTDVPPSFWGYNDITKMANLGLAGGYPDGTFKPNGKMTAAECLLFCARTSGIDAATKEQIARDHAAELQKVLPADINTWAAKELALGMEMGILSLSELDALADAGALGKTITRENICLYLVRAMQLEPLAKSLTNYTLTFKDQNQISPNLKPYVYVLNNFGIVKGDDLLNFNPQGKVTRAEMTTMLSRAVSFIDTAGISVELPDYTTYDWKAGTIKSVTPSANSTVLLTLESEFSGEFSCTLVDGVSIYKDNMLTNLNDLKVGQYVRLNLSPSGAIREARLGGVVTAVTGSVSALSDQAVSLSVNGSPRTYDITRFTQISAAGRTGGREVIDKDAGYVSAICYVDSLGDLVGLKLAGGTSRVTGLVKNVSTSNGVTTISVSQSDGRVTPYILSPNADTSVDGKDAKLSGTVNGKYVDLRVDSDTNKVLSAAVDTKSTYVQGGIRRVSTSGTRSVTIQDIFTGRETTYNYSDSVITYNGQPVSLSKLERGMFATLQVKDKQIIRLDAFPGESTAEGTLESITYGTTTTLKVKLADGTITTYELAIDDLPTILRDDKDSSVDRLRPGDQLEIFVRYHRVARIDATSQTANLTGTILSVNLRLGGGDLEIQAPDGSKSTYYVAESTPVTQGKTHSSLYALKPGYTVALVTSGDTVVSVDITSSASANTQITGTIFPTDSSRTITVLVNDAEGTQASPITVDVQNARLLNQSTGREIGTGNLEAGDTVVCYGSYSGATFHATIVIRQD